MKKIIFSTVLLVFMAGTISTSYGQEANKQLIKDKVNLNETPKQMSLATLDLMKTSKDSVNPKIEMMKTLRDSTSEFQGFKKAAKLKFSDTQKNIAVLRGKYLELDETDRTALEKISKLEQKNNDLKKSLADYTDGGEYDWSRFKNRFNYDMAELEEEIKDLVPNQK